jgi:hypothetical protein
MAPEDDRKPEDLMARPTAPRELKTAPQSKSPKHHGPHGEEAHTRQDPFGADPLGDADIEFDLLDEDEPDDVDIFDRDTKIPSLPSAELAAEVMRRLDNEPRSAPNRASEPLRGDHYQDEDDVLSDQHTVRTHRPQLATPVVDPPGGAMDASLLDELSQDDGHQPRPRALTRDSEPSWRDVLSSSPPPPRSASGKAQKPGNSMLDFADQNAAAVFSLAPSAGLEVEPSLPPPGAEPTLQDMQARYAVGDFTGALELAEAILQKRPDDAATRRYAQNCRDVLTQMFAAKIGPLDQVMQVVISPQEVQWLSLDHRAGFLLSLVDGQSTVDEILDISGMSRLDALKIIHQLVEQQIVNLA